LRAFDPTDPKSIILNTVFYAAAEHGESVITRTQEQFLHDLVAAEKALWKLEVVQTERESVLAQYRDTIGTYDSALELVEKSAEQLEEIKAIMEEVHGNVIRMQGELARIDARLKAKMERELIEKGLLDPKNAGASDGIPVKPQFSWPVYGRVSAGFLNESYKKYFGVPHYGLDIIVGQETPVGAAAEGVVFLVRDGGKTGYSYILIGHRGGFATLYGHVSQALVTAGQMVTAGQAIALSGGQPGSHGAGPMTTGPHLHFEVIQAGVNVDPKGVLP
jgi:murein DD-endopeptidase MepM/ murein hydrolase activator NlpD